MSWRLLHQSLSNRITDTFKISNNRNKVKYSESQLYRSSDKTKSRLISTFEQNHFDLKKRKKKKINKFVKCKL